MFWGAMAVLVLMLALTAWAVFRPRPADGAATTSRVSPNVFLVVGGLIFPGVVLTALLIWGIGAGHALLPLAIGKPVFTVEVTARQWQWDVAYPSLGPAPEQVGQTGADTSARKMRAATPNRIDIPAGKPVDIRVRSADVIHSFWVPRLGGKIDAIPGRTNVLRLTADAPGVYRGVCAEFCGTGHKSMALEVHAHDEATFARLMEDLR